MVQAGATDALDQAPCTALSAGLAAIGLELVEARYLRGAQTLRIFIERLPQAAEAVRAPVGVPYKSGITLVDCERATAVVEAVLAAEPSLPPQGSYVLEVSSPGLERPLNKAAHFARFLGHGATIKLRRQAAAAFGQRTFDAVIGEATEAEVTLLVADTPHPFAYADVERATLTPVWPSTNERSPPAGLQEQPKEIAWTAT